MNVQVLYSLSLNLNWQQITFQPFPIKRSHVVLLFGPTQSHSLNVQERRLVRVLWRAVVTRRVSFSFINGRKELSTDCNVFPSVAVFDAQGSTASVHVGGI